MRPLANPARSSKGGSPGRGSVSYEHCWHTAQAGHPNRTLAVDLTGVTFIDQAGRYLLQLMHRDGVRLVGSGLLLQDLLDDLRGSQHEAAASEAEAATRSRCRVRPTTPARCRALTTGCRQQGQTSGPAGVVDAALASAHTAAADGSLSRVGCAHDDES